MEISICGDDNEIRVHASCRLERNMIQIGVVGSCSKNNGVRIENRANIHHKFDGKEEDHKAKDDVRFENMVEKNAAEYSANWPVTTPDGENVTRQIVKWTVKLDLKALPDLEAGDTITITDTLSDGLRFVDGDDYVGLGSVLVGEDNEEITSGGPVQDGQTLTWTYKTLTKKVYTLLRKEMKANTTMSHFLMPPKS